MSKYFSPRDNYILGKWEKVNRKTTSAATAPDLTKYTDSAVGSFFVKFQNNFFQQLWQIFRGNHSERASIRMVEDNSGLGYKFQSSRRKGSSGNRVRREKLEKCKALLKQGFCWIHEKRWWVVIVSGVSLVVVSVTILLIQKSKTPINFFSRGFFWYFSSCLFVIFPSSLTKMISPFLKHSRRRNKRNRRKRVKNLRGLNISKTRPTRCQN